MSQHGIDDFDGVDYSVDESEKEFNVESEPERGTFNARRELERHMEIKRLREQLDYLYLDKF